MSYVLTGTVRCDHVDASRGDRCETALCVGAEGVPLTKTSLGRIARERGWMVRGPRAKGRDDPSTSYCQMHAPLHAWGGRRP